MDENDVLYKYKKYFYLSEPLLRELVNDFEKSLVFGLNEKARGRKNTSKDSVKILPEKYQPLPLKMLDSCVNKLPKGNETGVYYSIDMGGTNLRCIRIELNGNGINNTKIKITKLTDLKIKQANGKYEKTVLDSTVTSEEMFDKFAEFFGQFLLECGDIPKNKDEADPICYKQRNNRREDQESIFNLTFTFSFPVEQLEIEKANLITWTKGIETGRNTSLPVEGCDVGELLNSAFTRKNIPAHCKCIINDTIGTLISAIYDSNHAGTNNKNIDVQSDSDSTSIYSVHCQESGSKRLNTGIIRNPCIGVIIGTGLNSCYIEPESESFGYKGIIINTECGDFYSKNLPTTEFDLILDSNSDNKGEQLFEKMISGNYLGELSRLLIIKSLQEKTPKIFFQDYSVTTENISKIISLFENAQNNDYSELIKYLQVTFSFDSTPSLAKIIAESSLFVFNRAAQLVSVMISALFRRLENHYPTGITVAIDGSIWTKNQGFRKIVRESLRVILGDNINDTIQLLGSYNGSGKGAALLASIT